MKIDKLTCVDEKPPLGFRWETSQLTIFIPCDKSFFSARYSNAYADVSISTGLALGLETASEVFVHTPDCHYFAKTSIELKHTKIISFYM